MTKVWLVTGSSRGLGRCVAEAVLQHGDRLIATARKPEQLSDLVERYGNQIRAVTLDVTNPEQAKAATVSQKSISYIAVKFGWTVLFHIRKKLSTHFRH